MALDSKTRLDARLACLDLATRVCLKNATPDDVLYAAKQYFDWVVFNTPPITGKKDKKNG